MVLIDTHLVLWAALAPERLPPRAMKLLATRSSEVAFSVVSLWEVAIKSSLGRPDFQVDAPSLRQGLLDAGFTELGIRPEHVMRVADLPWVHRDPFDRLLVAQAMHEGITLLSADKTLKRYGKSVQSA
jgi:PIN domain nuclease of toxin-antitoxin system